MRDQRAGLTPSAATKRSSSTRPIRRCGKRLKARGDAVTHLKAFAQRHAVAFHQLQSAAASRAADGRRSARPAPAAGGIAASGRPQAGRAKSSPAAACARASTTVSTTCPPKFPPGAGGWLPACAATAPRADPGSGRCAGTWRAGQRPGRRLPATTPGARSTNTAKRLILPPAAQRKRARNCASFAALKPRPSINGGLPTTHSHLAFQVGQRQKRVAGAQVERHVLVKPAMPQGRKAQRELRHRQRLRINVYAGEFVPQARRRRHPCGAAPPSRRRRNARSNASSRNTPAPQAGSSTRRGPTWTSATIGRATAEGV